MSDRSQHRRADFSLLWPFAGNAFLLLFGCWLGYMGWAAQDPDVRTAFYGLAGVSGLLLLLGLRAAVSEPNPRRRLTPAPQAWEAPGAPRTRSAGRDRDRETKDPEGASPTDAPVRSGVAVEAGTRSVGVPPSRAAPPAFGEWSASLEDDADVIAAPAAASERPVRDGAGTADHRASASEWAEGLREELTRDKAQRGAQLTQLEKSVETVASRVDMLTERLAVREAATGTVAEAAEVVERLDALEKRIAGIPDRAERIQITERQDNDAAELSALAQRLAGIEAALAGLSELHGRVDRLESGEVIEVEGKALSGRGQLTELEQRLEDLEAAFSPALMERIDGLERAMAAERATGREGAIEALEKRLEGLENAAADAGTRTDVDAIEGRLSKVEATLAAPSRSPAGADGELGGRLAALEEEVRRRNGSVDELAQDLKSCVTVGRFDELVKENALPEVEKLVARRLDEMLTNGALRERIVPLVEQAMIGAAGEGHVALAKEVEALRATLAEERQARERLGGEVGRVAALAGTMAERSTAASSSEEGTLQRIASEREADRRELESLKAALAGLRQAAPDDLASQIRQLADRMEGVERRTGTGLEEATRAIFHMRENLGAITRHVTRMGDNYQELMTRFDQLPGPQHAEAVTSAEAVPADVNDVRDALATIIAENRGSREQKGVLTARFDRPTRVHVDTGMDGGAW